MKNDPLKPLVFKELNIRDKIFLLIMIALVVFFVISGRGCSDKYYYEEDSSQRTKNNNYSPSRKEYEDAFREADRAKKYLEEYNMKKKIERNIRGF